MAGGGGSRGGGKRMGKRKKKIHRGPKRKERIKRNVPPIDHNPYDHDGSMEHTTGLFDLHSMRLRWITIFVAPSHFETTVD